MHAVLQYGLTRKYPYYSLSLRDLEVMGQAKVSFNEMTRIETKHPRLPPAVVQNAVSHAPS